MARSLPKPWQKHRPNGKIEWYVTIKEGGKQKQKYLADDGISEEELQKKLLVLLAEVSIMQPGIAPGFLAVMNQYLDFVKKDQSPGQYRQRRFALNSFHDFLATQGLEAITCKELLKFHITKWLADNGQWGQNTRRAAILSIKACLKWGFDEGILKERLLDGLKAPPQIFRGPEVILTTEQRQLLVRECLSEHHKEILLALYSSGCRPSELCGLCAEDIRLDANPPMWIVRGKRTTSRPDGTRQVALTPHLVKLTKKLLAIHPTGPLFRNRSGGPYKPDTLGTFVYRLQKRLRKKGCNLPPKVIAYGFRHCFATDMLEGGALDYDIAKLMGHANTNMVHRVYGKHKVSTASRALQFLREISDDGHKPEHRDGDATSKEP